MNYQEDIKNAKLLKQRHFNYTDGWKDQRPHMKSFLSTTNTLENFNHLV